MYVCKLNLKIIFYPPVNTDKPKFVAFLVFVCTTASFIAQISSSENFLKGDAISLLVNSQGYSELLQPIKTRRNCYSLKGVTPQEWDPDPRSLFQQKSGRKNEVQTVFKEYVIVNKN